MYVTGSSSGKIHFWRGNSTTGVCNGHKGKVQSIIIKNENIYTGGDDGIINIWKKSKKGSI
jgi:WD40 repeat protein